MQSCAAARMRCHAATANTSPSKASTLSSMSRARGANVEQTRCSGSVPWMRTMMMCMGPTSTLYQKGDDELADLYGVG